MEEESITKGDLEVKGAVLPYSLSTVGAVLVMGNGLGIQAASLDLFGEAWVTKQKNGEESKAPFLGGGAGLRTSGIRNGHGCVPGIQGTLCVG